MSAASRPDRLRRGVVARYATGEIVTSGFAALPGLVLVYYLTDSLGVSALVAGGIIAVAKLWDIVIDPIVGALSDRELAATGARRRLMLLAAVVLPVFFVATFAVPAGTPTPLAVLWVFAAFLLAATGFSFFQVPYNVLPAELVPSYDGRTRLLAARVVVLAIAILLYGGGGPAVRDAVVEATGDELLGYLAMAIVAAVGFAVAILVTSGVEAAARGRTVAPPPASIAYAGMAAPRDSMAERMRRGFGMLRASQPFRALLATFMVQGLATGMMLAASQYVATWVLDDQEAITWLFVALIAPALVMAPIWGAIARRIGKERAYLIATLLFALAALSLLGLFVAPGLWVYAPVGLAGAAYAGMQALPMSMLPDVIGHDARRNGAGRGGSFSGVWTAGETIGLAFGAVALTVVLTVVGYDSSTAGEAVTQSATALAGIILAFSVLPGVLALVSLVSLVRYPLRKADIDTSDGPAPVVPGMPREGA